MDDLLETIRAFDGVLELAPVEGSRAPQIAWGDHFFYYAPDGEVPEREQPYATVVTKNYPDDVACHLDAPDRWRLNVHAGRSAFVELTGEQPRDEGGSWDYAVTDAVLPHPVHRAQAWVCIVNPGRQTQDIAVRRLPPAPGGREAPSRATQRPRELGPRRQPVAWSWGR